VGHKFDLYLLLINFKIQNYIRGSMLVAERIKEFSASNPTQGLLRCVYLLATLLFPQLLLARHTLPLCSLQFVFNNFL
jgi:hypothetical protein